MHKCLLLLAKPFAAQGASTYTNSPSHVQFAIGRADSCRDALSKGEIITHFEQLDDHAHKSLGRVQHGANPTIDANAHENLEGKCNVQSAMQRRGRKRGWKWS